MSRQWGTWRVSRGAEEGSARRSIGEKGKRYARRLGEHARRSRLTSPPSVARPYTAPVSPKTSRVPRVTARWRGRRGDVTDRPPPLSPLLPLRLSPPSTRNYPKWWRGTTRVMCRQISVRIAFVSGRCEVRERDYARPTAAWATRRASTAGRRWKAGFSNGRTTWKVTNGDGSSCQTASCRTTGSFLRVVRPADVADERRTPARPRANPRDLRLGGTFQRRDRSLDLVVVAPRSRGTRSPPPPVDRRPSSWSSRTADGKKKVTRGRKGRIWRRPGGATRSCSRSRLGYVRGDRTLFDRSRFKNSLATAVIRIRGIVYVNREWGGGGKHTRRQSVQTRDLCVLCKQFAIARDVNSGTVTRQGPRR